MTFDIWQVKEIGLISLLTDCAGLFLGRGRTQADLRSGGIKASLNEELQSSQMTGTNTKENDLRITFRIPSGPGDFLTLIEFSAPCTSRTVENSSSGMTSAEVSGERGDVRPTKKLLIFSHKVPKGSVGPEVDYTTCPPSRRCQRYFLPLSTTC